MKIAFATQDLATVNAHFGWAKHIMVYEISPEGYAHVETHNFVGDLQEDGRGLGTGFARPNPGARGASEEQYPHGPPGINEDKLAPKIEAVKACAILYVAAIGGSGAARVVAQKIHPVKARESEPISEILEKLKTVLGGTPPPWLRKAMLKDGERILELEEE